MRRHLPAAAALTAVLVVMAAGLGLIWADSWRSGAGVLAVAAGLAALLRLVLSPETAGILAVRSRTFDVLAFGAIAALFAAMALITVTRT